MNGPEDETTDWSLVNWRQVEDHVRRLRQRIFTASQAGDLAKVRNLQTELPPGFGGGLDGWVYATSLDCSNSR